MKPIFIIICIATVFYSCSQSSNNLEDTLWLSGSWEFAFNQSVELETWNPLDKELQGKGFFVSQLDTVPMRQMDIISENGQLILVIQEENFEYISKYEITYLSTDSLVAVTTSNVWPKTIIYAKPDATHLNKHMSGMQQQMNNSASSFYTLKK